MIKLFDSEFSVPIVCDVHAPESVMLALYDLQRNLRTLAGREAGFEIQRASAPNAIRVVTDRSLGVAETYSVRVCSSEILIAGSDELGTVYGIYAFATKCLGILPFYRLTDLFPEKCREKWLDEQTLLSSERPIRLRGWFINDEDLLSELQYSGGHRAIDYPFYRDVIDTDVLDMILETALRMEINLVIPASFLNVDNPDEERLIQAVTRRGLYISQHHVEPVGVSYFSADDYMKRFGNEREAVSFLSNRERMVEIWRYYIQKWAKYGDRVVWQLGLRGKADQAVWKSDPTVPGSMETRGAIISDAIGTQYEIIRETLGTDAFFSTATLWDEGSELYGHGFLRLPKGTLPVFSDLGLDQMFGEDLFRAGRGKQFGVYYHACFWTRGPHLTEGCDPRKMAYCYRAAAELGELCYSILNVSNVRPVHLSVTLNAELLHAPTSFDPAWAMRELDGKIFGDAAEAVNKIRERYYLCFADFGEGPLQEMAKSKCFYLRRYGDLPFIRNAATDGQLAYFGKYLLLGKKDARFPAKCKETERTLEDSMHKFESLLADASLVETELLTDRLRYFEAFLKYPIEHMLQLTRWCIGCMRLLDETLSRQVRIAAGSDACVSLERILQARTVLECGEWEHWHRGEKKINIAGLLKMTEKTMEDVKA